MTVTAKVTICIINAKVKCESANAPCGNVLSCLCKVRIRVLVLKSKMVMYCKKETCFYAVDVIQRRG